MKILLFVTSIYNTLDNAIEEDYNKLIENLEKIQDINEFDAVYISFCDNTENRNVMLLHARKLLDKLINKHIYFGEQFLGDVHYKDINKGAILYKNQHLNKIEEIINYVKRLENSENEVELIIADSEMNIKKYKSKLNNNSIEPFTLISGNMTLKDINHYLENLYSFKKKSFSRN